MTDTIADMLTRIRNALKSKLITVECPYSKEKYSILKVLEKEGYINGSRVIKDKGIDYIKIDLKFSNTGTPAISEISRVSKPGKRVYSSISKLKGCYNNMGIYVMSTPKGMLSDRDAHRLGVGGEIICKVF
jgi:small subunit ribosomal protein S8